MTGAPVDPPRDSQVVLESAMASRRVGDIRQRLGQLAQAEQDFKSSEYRGTAIAMLETLAGQHPNEPDYARCHAVTLAKLGMLYWRTGRLARAAECLEGAFETQRNVITGFPDLPSHNRVLLELLRLRWGQVCWERRTEGEPQSTLPVSRDLLEACVERLTELTARAELAQDGLAWRTLPVAYETLSLVQAELGEPERPPKRLGAHRRSEATCASAASMTGGKA